MSFAALALLALISGLLAYDWATQRGNNRRSLLLQTVVFAIGGYFVMFPDRATDLAHVVGIGRGVDFFLYPTVIWLVRESLLTRRRRLDDAERLTRAVRALAIAEARAIEAPPREG